MPGIKSPGDNTLIAYGRGANALVRQAAAEGVTTTPEEMRDLIAKFYDKFKYVKAYIDSCHRAVVSPGYVENAYGRRRYFYKTSDKGVQAAQRREAQNTPIQGTIADALSIALINVHDYIRESGMKSRLVLPVHDAIFMIVPWYEVNAITKTVLPVCMTYGNQIPNTELKLKIEIEVMKRWSEKIDINEAIELAKKEETDKA